MSTDDERIDRQIAIATATGAALGALEVAMLHLWLEARPQQREAARAAVERANAAIDALEMFHGWRIGRLVRFVEMPTPSPYAAPETLGLSPEERACDSGAWDEGWDKHPGAPGKEEG